jgi:hypothetical protein
LTAIGVLRRVVDELIGDISQSRREMYTSS